MANERKQRRTRAGRASHSRQAHAGPRSQPSTAIASPDRRTLHWGLAVAVAAVVVYLIAFGNAFVLDDIRLIRDDVRIRSLANIPGLLASPYWDVSGAQGLYRPLVL